MPGKPWFSKIRFDGTTMGLLRSVAGGIIEARTFDDGAYGTLRALVNQIGGSSGPLIRNVSGALEVRDSTDAAYAVIRVLPPLAANDAANRDYVLNQLALPYLYSALDFIPTNNSDWAVNATAQLTTRAANAAVSTQCFDDTIEEGVGTPFLYIPVGVTNLTFDGVVSAYTAPAGTRTFRLKLYTRNITLGSAIPAWSAGTVFADGSVGATTNPTRYNPTAVSLATLGLTAGQWCQLQYTRVAPAAGTNITGDLCLTSALIGFS